MRIIDYTRELVIANVSALPAGLNAKYLECISDTSGGLIAKQWRRVLPKTAEIVVRFGGKPQIYTVHVRGFNHFRKDETFRSKRAAEASQREWKRQGFYADLSLEG